MTLTLTFGWWLLPMLVSIIGLICSIVMTRNQGTDWFGIGSFFTFVTYVMFFVVPSLIAWLIWALLK